MMVSNPTEHILTSICIILRDLFMNHRAPRGWLGDSLCVLCDLCGKNYLQIRQRELLDNGQCHCVNVDDMVEFLSNLTI